MSDRLVVTLEEVVDDIVDRRGVTPLKLGSDFKPSGHRVISAKSIKNRRVDLTADEERFIDAPTFAKWMKKPLKAGDVILTSEAPLGEPAYVEHDVDWVLGQRLFGLRTNPKRILGRYLYYALQTDPLRDDILSRATGSVAQGIRQSELRKAQLILPPLDEQKCVSNILGTLDDKIELNRRMAATLEAMARAIFKSWFIDFDPVHAKTEGRPTNLPPEIDVLIPDSFEDSELGPIPTGWEVGKLGDLCRNLRRPAPVSSISAEEPYIGLDVISKRSLALMTWGKGDQVESQKSRCKDGEILFGKLRPYFHKVCIAPVDGVCSTDILVIDSKEPSWYSFIVLMLSEVSTIEFVTAASDGTRMPRTKWEDLDRMPIVMPPCDLAKQFDSSVRTSLERLKRVSFECQSLAGIRDALLPKLISGELSVSEVESANAQARA